MRFSDDLLRGPLENFSKALALERVYGMASSYVRNAGATLNQIDGQVRAAFTQTKASDWDIKSKIQEAITDQPKADAERVRNVRQRFLA